MGEGNKSQELWAFSLAPSLRYDQCLGLGFFTWKQRYDSLPYWGVETLTSTVTKVLELPESNSFQRD